jgi:hypothetical protein
MVTAITLLKKHRTMETKEQTQNIPWMKGLASCSNKMKEDGFKEDFQICKGVLTTFNESKTYTPDQVKIVNFYRFEGESDPGDNSVLYVIETSDGTKGTLVDSYGAYASEEASKFIVAVEEIQKQIPGSKENA